MKHIFIIGISIFWIGFISCSDDKIDTLPATTRTILVYMMANNSLGNETIINGISQSYDDANIEAMIKGISNGNNNGKLLIYYAGKGHEDNTLFEIKDNRKNFVKQYDEQDPTDPAVMQQVIADVVSQYPAESYGLILWSHGTGWLPSDFNSMLRAFGQDGSRWMEIDELAQGIPDHVFDFILFDACYMASVECAYELRNKADYILASPTEIMGIGWPYDQILPLLFETEPKLEEACEAFYNYYLDYPYPYATVSLTCTSELESLREAVRDILADTDESALLSLDLSNVQRLEYLSPTNIGKLYDLEDFLKQLATEEQRFNLARCLDNAVPYKAHTSESFYAAIQAARPIEDYCGLNVFVPRPASLPLWNWYKNRIEWYHAVYQ